MTGTARITTGGRITRSTAKNQVSITDTARPKRGRKPKNSSAETTTQLQETIDQQPPEEIEAEPVVTAPKRGRKPKKIIETSDTITEATTSNSSGKKRKTTTEDNNGEAEESNSKQIKKTKTKKSTEKKVTKTVIKSPKKQEERLAKLRSACTAPIRERIHRAESQRIYMVSRKTVSETHQEFAVLGSTGNVYTVTISHLPNCTCPDFLKGNLCKHIIFVYLRVCRLNKNSTYIYQKALLTDELKTIFANAAPDPAVLANQRVRDRYEELNSGESSNKNEGRRPIEGDCPICYELLEEKDHDKIVWCKECGNNLHKDCFEQWKKSKHGGTVTCVYCRSTWRERVGEAAVNEEGYLNLGGVQGMNTKRDTSTYYKPGRYREGSFY